MPLANLRREAAGTNAEETALRRCLPGEIDLSIIILLATVQYVHMVIYDPPMTLRVVW
jgi:hypothetical protein